eukprot:473932-Pelagomonas_calceolata.AAC.1
MSTHYLFMKELSCVQHGSLKLGATDCKTNQINAIVMSTQTVSLLLATSGPGAAHHGATYCWATISATADNHTDIFLAACLFSQAQEQLTMEPLIAGQLSVQLLITTPTFFQLL